MGRIAVGSRSKVCLVPVGTLLAVAGLGWLSSCSPRQSASRHDGEKVGVCRPRCQRRSTGRLPALADLKQPRSSSRRARAYLRRQGYTPDREVEEPLRHGPTVLLVRSICTGSADGHCQALDVFRVGRSRPIWHGQYGEVLGVRSLADGFAVRAAHYRPQDPLCCPSGKPITIVYRWTGHTFAAHKGASRHAHRP